MSIDITLPEAGPNLRPTITVMGVGGAGGNAVNNMIRSNLEGVEFLVANTDAQALGNSPCENRIQLGLKSTKGLGAGMRPDIGRQAAEEAIDEIKEKLTGSHMVFIAAGMGGGTGTGAGPVIAQLAREIGILTVGVITKPFHFEGTQRMKLAEGGIEQLQQQVDTLITIPNQNLFRVANEKTTFSDAFKMADDILYAGVRGVTDLMVQPGLINLDFSDIKTVMSEMGKAMMGTAQSDAPEGRAIEAAEKAIANPLIDDVSLKGAKGLIINITGGKDLTLYEVDEAANRIKQEVQEEANIIYGTTCDDRLEGIIRVSIVATGIDSNLSNNYYSKEHPVNLYIDNSIYQEKKSAQVNNFSNEKKDSEEGFGDINPEIIKPQETVVEEKLNNDEINYSPSVFQEKEEKENEEDKDSSNSFLSSDDRNNSVEEEAIKPSNNLNNDEKNVFNDSEEESKPSVRKLSLFDNLNESSNDSLNSTAENVDKNEPILEKSETFLESDLDSENESSKDFESEDVLSEEEFNQEQEEELLDIPTFLRRQAN